MNTDTSWTYKNFQGLLFLRSVLLSVLKTPITSFLRVGLFFLKRHVVLFRNVQDIIGSIANFLFIKNYLAFILDEQWGCPPPNTEPWNTEKQGTSLQLQPLHAAEKQPQSL